MIERIKMLTISILLALLATACVSGDKQKLGDVERKQNFDFNWKFALGDFPDAWAHDFDDNNWQMLDLPHDWSIEGEINVNNPMGNDGGYFPSGKGWYRKTFNVPAAWDKQKVAIYFEGVYMNSEVYINGKSLGQHPYGYTSFNYDLTSYLEFGKENIIAVQVDNSQQKNCRWYSGSGIYRHVWLMVTAPVHIDHWGVAITTAEVSKERATVQVKTLVKNETTLPQSIMLLTQLSDKDSKKVGRNEVELELQANTQKEVIQNIEVTNPLLWNLETPNLYSAQIEIKQKNKTIDRINNSFGIRSIKFTAENGFELNGQTIKLNGGCVHHDNGCLGAAAYDRAEERKVELLKAAGFNAVRTSHNPPSESFLNACDRLGLLVIDELFDGWKVGKTAHDYASVFNDWWQRDVEAMVLRDRNHPSIIMWSSGNEIIERAKPEAVETARMLNSYIRKLDPSRPVTSAMTSWGEGWEIFDPLMAEHDVCGYNYQIQYAESDHNRLPSRIILQTESYPNDAFYNWNIVRKNNYILGDFVWTAMDYLGESGIGGYYYPGEQAAEHYQSSRYPWHGAYCGDIDLTGWRKPISHYRNLLWNNTEKLYMAVREPNPDQGTIQTTMWGVWPTWESWNWPMFQGKEIQVEVYSKYPKVRLYLNNELIGELPTTEEQQYKATFTLTYLPGELKAIGIDNNKEMETTVLKTAGNATHIKLTPDRAKICANGQDLSFITVEVTDEKGNMVTNADNEVLFTIKGEGEIVGVDNANLKNAKPYIKDRCTTWNGRALVVVKSSHKSGKIKLTVSSAGLSDAILIINTVKN